MVKFLQRVMRSDNGGSSTAKDCMQVVMDLEAHHNRLRGKRMNLSYCVQSSEVVEAIKKLRIGKVPGHDDIPAELLK